MKTFCVVTIVLVLASVCVDARGNRHHGGLMGTGVPRCLKTCKDDCTEMKPCALATCPSVCHATREAAEGSGANRCMIRCGLTQCLPRFPSCKACVARCAAPVTACKRSSCASECPAGMTIPEHMQLSGCVRCMKRNCRNIMNGN
uniref:Vanadium binding protein 4 n=1 Tax=Ciona intestinalis TaxID=7719 RepID=A7VMU9_CIOIN|nr:vanadium binding protein 4 precursor [Ciona intestinalis]XP_009857872.1 vanadium binding protein 4 isoform X1 [Ciona intestinalis]BAF76319.1 vanadium binding protein 4 [Ciona intestinalis]|eukprot:NP_001122355.1 vanadium binding protein 4 precursor [Ciona intestinalis]